MVRYPDLNKRVFKTISLNVPEGERINVDYSAVSLEDIIIDPLPLQVRARQWLHKHILRYTAQLAAWARKRGRGRERGFSATCICAQGYQSVGILSQLNWGGGRLCRMAR